MSFLPFFAITLAITANCFIVWAILRLLFQLPHIASHPNVREIQESDSCIARFLRRCFLGDNRSNLTPDHLNEFGLNDSDLMEPELEKPSVYTKSSSNSANYSSHIPTHLSLPMAPGATSSPVLAAALAPAIAAALISPPSPTPSLTPAASVPSFKNNSSPAPASSPAPSDGFDESEWVSAAL
eukprot:TRINITY_DN3267_c0_g1_i3.p1 TRINITY_DN3267_c0_g1~~TRINITY_DN3267_c0_g1_i3.p1  ORF type:complete len:183 (+),score=32.08 TRINITY_DN3267_c0_g1_i3:99-647(+)